MAQFAGDYLHRDLFEMAAAYLFHIVLNHPFVDANKRVGAMAADVFLMLNGKDLKAPGNKFEEMVFAVAEGKLDKPSAAAFLRRYTLNQK